MSKSNIAKVNHSVEANKMIEVEALFKRAREEFYIETLRQLYALDVPMEMTKTEKSIISLIEGTSKKIYKELEENKTN